MKWLLVVILQVVWGGMLRNRLRQVDICNGDDGCIFAVKQPMFIPLRNPVGASDAANEYFEQKIMLVYANRLVFFDTDQNQVFIRENPPKKWLRTVYYTDIQLDCGADANKLCTVKEFQEHYPGLKPNETVTNGLKGTNVENLCTVFPLIDSTDVAFPNSLIYLCQKNDALLREHHIQRDKISRFIDTFQLSQVKDHGNALNAVIRKIGVFKTADAMGEPVEATMVLYFHKMVGYTDPQSYITQKVKLNLREVLDEGVLTIPEAKNQAKLKKADWNTAKGKYGLTGLKEKCCIVILKKGGAKQYMCLVDNEDKSCEVLVLNWVRLLNAYASKLNFLEDQDSIKEEAKGMECADPKMKLVKRRIINAAEFQNEVCRGQQLVLMTYSDANCAKDREDQTAEETRLLCDGDKDVQDLIEKCIKSGDIVIPTDV